MNNIEFNQRVLTPLKAHKPSVDHARLLAFYEDFLRIYDISQAIEDSVSGRNESNLLFSGEKTEGLQVFATKQQIITLLKTLYLLAEVFINAFLHEGLDRPRPHRLGSGISLDNVLRNHRLPLSPEIILPAYCAVVYRNMLVAHHNYYLHPAAQWSMTEGMYRLCPTSFTNLTEDDVSILENLYEKYLPTIPQLANEGNRFNRLKLLFYNVPIGDIKYRQSDRWKVNNLVELIGCESMTRQELLEAIGQFALEVVEAVGKL